MAGTFTPPTYLAPVVGNLTGEPRRSTLPNSNTAKVEFSVAMSDPNNKINPKTNEPYPTYVDCSAIGRLAENLAASLHKGDAFIGLGRLNSFSTEVPKLNRQTGQIETDPATGQMAMSNMGRLNVSLVVGGPDLTFASAVVTRNPKGGNAGGQGNQTYQQQPAAGFAPQQGQPQQNFQGGFVPQGQPQPSPQNAGFSGPADGQF